MNLKKGKFEHTHLHTGRMPCNDQSRDKGNASKVQGMQNIIGKGAEARNKHRINLSPSFKMNQPCQYFVIRFLAS